MQQLRQDPVTGRWIIVNFGRVIQPHEFSFERPVKVKDSSCPFCPNNESLTPPEIIAFRKTGEKDTPGWWIRVVPNKFPALKIEGELDKRGIGIYDKMNGIGAHEVIIDCPNHMDDVGDYSVTQAEEMVWAYLDRSMDLERDKRFKYILIFRNYGKSAGASLEHPHSQLIALPVVPKRVKEELRKATAYFLENDRCVFCDIIAQEKADNERIVMENEKFIAFCPFVSRFPYEVWITPKNHRSHFASTQKEDVSPFAHVLKQAMLKIKKLLNDPPYNYIIHTSPINGFDREDFHWHMEIMPKLVNIAGFEWGSGFYVNPVPPEMAADNLAKI